MKTAGSLRSFRSTGTGKASRSSAEVRPDLAAAEELNRLGFSVTLFEAARRPGGLLRYGIPDFKLEKTVIDRRLEIMERSGIEFVCSTRIGSDVSADYLTRRFDAVVLAIGTPSARDLPVEGRGLAGVHFALEFLQGQNRVNAGGIPQLPVSATGRHVVVIGGGDTGSDCVGTAIRQGAASVAQIEIMPRPPERRSPSTPWPQCPTCCGPVRVTRRGRTVLEHFDPPFPRGARPGDRTGGL